MSDSATLWRVAHQALLSMGCSRQEYWSGLPCPPPGDLPDPGDWTSVSCISCICRQILYHQCRLGSPQLCHISILNINIKCITIMLQYFIFINNMIMSIYLVNIYGWKWLGLHWQVNNQDLLYHLYHNSITECKLHWHSSPTYVT